jgi:mono/diheme cytochrome c family protein
VIDDRRPEETHETEACGVSLTVSGGESAVKFLLIVVLIVTVGAVPPAAADRSLDLTGSGVTKQFRTADLLERSDTAIITVPHDAAYGRAMTYRAVPLRDLLAELPPDAADTIEARATDGFVLQLPRALIAGPAVPWIAVEDPAHSWPILPGKARSAGPFYLIWENPGAARLSSEQWPYALAALTEVASPVQRWPAIAVAASLPADAAARRGQAVFIANCLPCHRLAGNGEGTMGPDLLRPMPATTYLTDAGLRALIRNPASVRHWPAQQMPGFDTAAIPDSDVDAVIAYLHQLVEQSK